MKNIVFIAPPAAGKGTQSDLLVKKYGYVHISTGDLLRNEMSNKTDLGLKIKDLMDNGEFVSDEIVTDLLKNKLATIPEGTGFILDGYPRNIAQAEILNDLLTELNKSLDCVIYLEMSSDVAMKRALGRITCPKCGRGYNKYESVLKPKVEWLCDDCSVELTSRSDDTEETFKTRFNTYILNTNPLLNYYEKVGILKVIDNSGTPEETFSKIESVI